MSPRFVDGVREAQRVDGLRLIAVEHEPPARVAARAPAVAPDAAAVVAIGALHADPTAFLLRTLPRLAAAALAPGARRTLVCANDPAAIDAAFAQPAVRAMLAVLGIERARCIAASASGTEMADRPEADGAATDHGQHRLLATIAERLAGPFGDRGLAGAVHLSAAEAGGDALDGALADAGWTVLRRDDRPFAETVALVRGAARLSVCCLGAADGRETGWNAALCGFARPGATIRALVSDGVPPALARATADNRGASLAVWRPVGAEAAVGPGFAERWLAVVDAPPAPAGRVRASSVGEGAPDAVLGVPPSGRARFRSEPGTRPWWELDLGRRRPVASVGADVPPADGGSTTLRLLGSPDMHDWVVLHDGGGLPAGHVLGDVPPLRFAATTPWTVRGLRIQLGGDGVLALDRAVVAVADGGESGRRW